MKSILALVIGITTYIAPMQSSAQAIGSNATNQGISGKNLYIDVHQLTPGKVKFADVAKAHAKDLAVQHKYKIDFLKFWVDEENGLVYCLSAAKDSSAIRKTHAEAHGLLPSHIYPVTDGPEALALQRGDFFLDIHQLGAGKVTAKAVADAHKKDLSVQNKYGVNFINYWVDTKDGVVMCLSQARDSAAIVETHQEAHGLLPVRVLKVKEGK